MIPPELERDVETLREQGYALDVQQDGQRIYLVFHGFPLGSTYRPEISDLMVFTTIQYPNAGFDMFWVDQTVVLASSGGHPQAADQFEEYLGKRWRRFSWHLQRPWNPSKDSLLTWMCTVEERLHRGV